MKLPHPHILAVFLGCCVALPFAGCEQSAASTANVEVNWDIFPDSAGDGTVPLVVSLGDSLGRPLGAARVQVEATMTHPGMQPVFTQARETAPGRYESTLKLTMSGDWVLLLDVTLPDGQAVQVQRELPGVRVP